jgi:rubrerythrin
MPLICVKTRLGPAATVATMNRIQTPPELYAHAIAIEQEAAARYSEFAERMVDLGNDGVAEIFSMLAQHEAEHLETLKNRTDGVALPRIDPEQYHWLDAGAPETAAREWLYRLLTPRQALQIALQAEKRAQVFFEHVFITAGDPGLRMLAKEMALEEGEHVCMVERLLERNPEPQKEWLST